MENGNPKLAPVILFVYNRPDHTLRTLQALEANDLADKSTLYIYSDGPKTGAARETITRINEVRALIRSRRWCGEVKVIESPENRGLADSLIKGITEVISVHGKAIILEDDIVTARGFLKFMNAALDQYAHAKNVAGVSGWNFPLSSIKNNYFSGVGACWGWATWQHVWENVNFDTRELIAKLESSGRMSEYNIEGGYDFFSMLKKQAEGKTDSWAIRFYTSYFLDRKLFLFPGTRLAENIGFDASGTNYTSGGTPAIKVSFRNEEAGPGWPEPIELPAVRKEIVAHFKPLPAPSGRENFWLRLKKKFAK